MSWYVPAYDWLVHAALVSLLILAAGSLAVLGCRQPVRRIRLIELTLIGCLLAPWLGMIPGYPRLSVCWWRVAKTDSAAATLDRVRLAGLDPVLIEAVVRRVLKSRGAGGDTLTRRALKPLLRAVSDGEGGKREFHLGNGLTVTVERRKVRVRGASER